VADRPRLQALEPRWLLSADLVPGIGSPGTSTDVNHELIVVDATVPDAAGLAASLASAAGDGARVVVLDPDTDGIEAVTRLLEDMRELDALHLVGHGTEGGLFLGSSFLDAAEAERRAATLVRWHNALKADADILLYGCRTAWGVGGDRLLATLAQLTGADVAGSDDLTGSSRLGGDWVLEARTGAIEARVLAPVDPEAWDHLLTRTVASPDTYAVAENGVLVVAPAAAGLRDWWRFDEGSGQSAADASAPANTATLGSTTGVDASDPTWTTGRAGNAALSFDGSSDFAFASSTALRTDNSFTVSAWIKADSTTGARHIVWAGYAGGNGWGDPSGGPSVAEMHLSVGRYDRNDRITFFLGYDASNPSGDPLEIISARTFTDTTRWHHVAAVVSDAGGGVLSGALYVDGVLEGTDTGVENDRTAWSASLLIGSPGAASRFFDGLIDEVRIYDTSLSQAEVVAIARAGVLENDTDPLGAGLSAILVSGPANGSLSLREDGSFTYTPNTGFSGTDSFTYRSSDGNDLSAVATVTLNVSGVNDPPVNTVPATIDVVEDSASALTGISVFDVDAGSANLRMTLSVGTGTLAAAAGGGVAVGGTAAALTLTGSAADLNAFIADANVTYTTAPNANGTVTLTVTTSDLGDTGTGGAQSDVDTVSLAITPVNDDPVMTAAEFGVTDGGALTLGPGSFSATDVETPFVGLVFTVSNVTGGSFVFAIAPGTPITAFTGAQLQSGAVRFISTGGPATFDVEASDGALATPPVAGTVTVAPPPAPAPATTTPPVPDGVVADISPPDLPRVDGPGVTVAPPGPAAPPVRTPAPVPLPRTPVLTLPVPRTPIPKASPPPAPAETAAIPDTPPKIALVEKPSPKIEREYDLSADTPDPLDLPEALLEPEFTVQLAGVLDGPDAQATRVVQLLAAVRFAGLSLSVGVVTWVLRAGGLLSSLLALLPAWRHVDPLPILARGERRRDRDEWQEPEREAKEDERRIDAVLDTGQPGK
jgi:VCBS repeat-containing protein